MRIINPAMLRKMERALKHGGNMYTLDDIGFAIKEGKMQSHVMGDTWIITEVHDFPRNRVVHVLFVVGNLDETLAAEQNIQTWANKIGADKLTAIGREGWWKFNTQGWNKTGTLYSKDINHERR